MDRYETKEEHIDSMRQEKYVGVYRSTSFRFGNRKELVNKLTKDIHTLIVAFKPMCIKQCVRNGREKAKTSDRSQSKNKLVTQ